MVERDPVCQAIQSVPDGEAFKEACALFGKQVALEHLRQFRAEFVDHLHRIDQLRSDPDALRRLAHQTVGRAGILGFPELAAASMDLEDAIRRGAGVATALDQWTAQARSVVAMSLHETDPPDQDAT